MFGQLQMHRLQKRRGAGSREKIPQGSRRSRRSQNRPVESQQSQDPAALGNGVQTSSCLKRRSQVKKSIINN